MLHLLNSQIMNAALDAALSESIDKSVQQHLDMCQECRLKFDWLKVRFSEEGAAILRNAPEPEDKSRCLNESQMEALLDKTLSVEESERLINHTTECPFCLENLRSLFTARKKGYLKEASPYEAKMSLEIIRKIFKPERIPVIIRILQKGLELISGREVVAEMRMPPLKKRIMSKLASESFLGEDIQKKLVSKNEEYFFDKEMMLLREEKANLMRKIHQLERRERELLDRKQRIQESHIKRIPMKTVFQDRRLESAEEMADFETRKSLKDRKKKRTPDKVGGSDRIELKDDDSNPLYSIIFGYEFPEQASLTAICLSDKIDTSDLEVRLEKLIDEQVPVKTPKMTLPSEELSPYVESKGKRTALFSGLKTGRYLLILTHPDLPVREFEIEIR